MRTRPGSRAAELPAGDAGQSLPGNTLDPRQVIRPDGPLQAYWPAQEVNRPPADRAAEPARGRQGIQPQLQLVLGRRRRACHPGTATSRAVAGWRAGAASGAGAVVL